MLLPGAGWSRETERGVLPGLGPPDKGVRVRVGVPAVGLAAAATAPGTRGSGSADLPPSRLRPRLRPPPPPPSATEHRERPLLGGGAVEEEKRMGRDSGLSGEVLTGLAGLSQGQLEMTHSPF